VSAESYFVAAEIQEKPDLTLLHSVVLDCMRLNIPVKLYVAFPEKEGHNPLKEIDKAHKIGLGIIEVRDAGVHVVKEAVPLSLWGYRLDRLRFPAKYRSLLADAENTYRDGSPAKGCGLIYDEIEDLTRKLAIATHKKGMWRTAPTLNLQTGPWHKVMEQFERNLIKARYRALTGTLLHRIMGITGHRNESGHKPSSAAQRVRRDAELRTRFESAIDLLYEIVRLPKVK
jgi:hypothetical protein